MLTKSQTLQWAECIVAFCGDILKEIDWSLSQRATPLSDKSQVFPHKPHSKTVMKVVRMKVMMLMITIMVMKVTRIMMRMMLVMMVMITINQLYAQTVDILYQNSKYASNFS